MGKRCHFFLLAIVIMSLTFFAFHVNQKSERITDRDRS